MEQLQTFVSHTQWPLLTAFVLGVLVALHPCPMATNVAAMGYIGRHVTDRRRVFTDGLIYTLGRTVSYSLIGAVLMRGRFRMGRADIGTAAYRHRPVSVV